MEEVKKVNRRYAIITLVICAILFYGCQKVRKNVSADYATESAKITSEANQAVDSGDIEKAELLVEKLDERGYIGAYEIKARIQSAKGEHDKALELVNEALALSQDDLVLLVQRANILSDLKRFEESNADYEKAKKLEGNRADIDFNQGLMLTRWGKFDEAVECFNRVLEDRSGEHYWTGAEGLKVHCLIRADRESEAKEVIETLQGDRLANAWSNAADGYHYLGKGELALAAALKSLHHKRANDEMFWYVREYSGQVDPDNRVWNMLVNIMKEQQSGYISYKVVAKTAEEGLEMIRKVEPSWLKILDIEESEKGEVASDSPGGVYDSTGIIFYDETDS